MTQRKNKPVLFSAAGKSTNHPLKNGWKLVNGLCGFSCYKHRSSIRQFCGFRTLFFISTNRVLFWNLFENQSTFSECYIAFLEVGSLPIGRKSGWAESESDL